MDKTSIVNALAQDLTERITNADFEKCKRVADAFYTALEERSTEVPHAALLEDRDVDIYFIYRVLENPGRLDIPYRELGLDSLDGAEIGVNMEERLGVGETYDVENKSTIGEILITFYNQLNCSKAIQMANR